MGQAIQIVEVGPRDGLQNEQRLLNTDTKVQLIHRLLEAGVKRLEATSFVSPNAVPQLADAEEVVGQVRHASDIRLSALVLNGRGFRRALATPVREVNFALLVTDTFNERNQGKRTLESVSEWGEVANTARSEGFFVTLTIGAAFGCPFEGEVDIDRFKEVVGWCLEAAQPDEMCIADTIGAGVPGDVGKRIDHVKQVGFSGSLRCHFHNTRNSGYANAMAAVDHGVHALDSSVAGLGGCPFSPQASGNIATEDLVYLLERSGYPTGIDLARLIDVSHWAESLVGHEADSMLSKAAAFPP